MLFEQYSIRIIIPHHCLRKTILNTLPNALWMWGLQFGWWEQELFFTLCELWALFPLILLDGFYTQLLFPHSLVLISILPEYLMGIFIAALSSQVLRPMNSSHLGFAGLSAPFLKSGNPLSFAWILLPLPFWKLKRWQTAAFIGITLSGFHLSEIMVFHCLIPGI